MDSQPFRELANDLPHTLTILCTYRCNAACSQKKTAIGAGTPVAAVGTRFYGEPASVTNGRMRNGAKFMLPLSHAGFPSDQLNDASRICGLWDDVLTDDVAATRFFRDPGSYFQSIGIDEVDTVLVDESATMLHTLTTPAFRDSLRHADYRSAFSHLAGTGAQVISSPLSTTLSTILNDHSEALRSELSLTAPANSDLAHRLSMEFGRYSGAPDEVNLAAIAAIMRFATQSPESSIQCASCVVAVAIAATVVLYISVLVGVTVGVLAGVWVSVGVSIAIASHGTGPIAQIAPSFSGKFIRMDPTAFRHATRLLRISRASGDAGFQNYVLRETVRQEIQAVVVALADTDLVPVAKEHQPLVVDVLSNYVNRSMGVTTNDAL
jgi:hypothetical protein